MSLRLNRAWLMLALLMAGNTFALGLGDIRLNSALNEPLRADIALLSATPEELEGLKVELAGADTFARYGLDRPLYLTRLQFAVVRSGRSDGNVVRITSQTPLTEPFVTLLVEATWSSGRLLREYTVLLDPPTFAPPPTAQSSQAVQAPSRAAPADSGQIQRTPPGDTAAPATRRAEPADSGTFDTSAGGDVQVQRGDTLWGIAQRVRPDNRLAINQVMLAIFEANPDAFAGNINRLTAGAELRIPSADDIFRINRGDALSEVQRHNNDFGIAQPASDTRPSLTLVPPDADQEDYTRPATRPGTDAADDAALQTRIRELEAEVSQQSSLLEIRDNELAQLRQELARMREQAGVAAPADPLPVDEPAVPADDPGEVFVEEDPEPAVDEETPAVDEAVPAPVAERPAPRVVPAPAAEPGIVDRLISLLTSIWGIIGLALIVAIVVLLWFAKRAAGRDEESTGVWEALDDDNDVDSESRASTERLRALARDDDSSIVVVEQETGTDRRRKRSDTMEIQRIDDDAELTSETGRMPALDDTFSSETALNLDQTDPIAEADFHMAYGLYDQAADLINGALAIEPEREDLMAKLCEIYFVWGNRDAFIDAASRLHDQLGGETSPDWDKTVIMGQQIAGDHRLFSGVVPGSATRAVDLSFDDSGESGVLDMDLGSGPDGEYSNVIDMEADDQEQASGDDALDFVFDDEPDTGSSTTREMAPRVPADESTVESPTLESPATSETTESPTIEQQLASLDRTSELPAFSEADNDHYSGDATAEIDLDDLGLDLDALASAGLDDDESDTDFADIEATSENRALQPDKGETTGRNRNIDHDLDATGEMPLFDESTGKNPAVPDDDDTGTEFDASLLDATGQTQVLRDDFGDGRKAGDDEATMLAPLDDDEAAALFDGDIDFDFAETEALPKDTFKRGSESDETGEMPKPGSGSVDLDLDDLTAALRISEGDTVDQPRDDATVERPRPGAGSGFGDLDDESPTEALSPDDVSDDLQDARTMTEVGTKLDLARAYVDMGDPEGARSILEEVLDEGDEGQRQQAKKLIDSLPE